ncbi:MAG TPA: ABC transporter substrate-binding protein [Stellaceae bacterium]|jgi:NitT/TauT family transport system substrate-binding protein|nr:ABC transporter substrate-binding protein [Stellaceae bacterium]
MVRWISALAVAGLVWTTSAQAEAIKVGILKVGASGPLYVAQERGYFDAENLQVELANFGAGQAVAVAVASGDIAIGVTGLTAGLYNLASNGQIRVVAGLHREAHGFHTQGYFASKRAYDAGLTTLRDIAGHSVALTTIGSTTHYAVALLAMKYGFPLDSVRILPLQSNTNSAAAVAGGQADAAMVASTMAPEVEKGGARLLGWVGDETPWQIGSVFVTGKTADEHGGMIRGFLKALAKGARDYHDAFTDAQELRANRPSAPAMLAIMSKYLGALPEKLDGEIPYVDPQLRLDLRDMARQIDWYRSQGMVKGDITVDRLVDRRYAVPLQ